jgi:hypothetical protein
VLVALAAPDRPGNRRAGNPGWPAPRMRTGGRPPAAAGACTRIIGIAWRHARKSTLPDRPREPIRASRLYKFENELVLGLLRFRRILVTRV